MKRISIILLTIAIALMAGTASVDAKKRASGGKSRTVYYVVVGSYSILDNAIERESEYPDAFDCMPIFVGKANGQTVYRIVYSMHYSLDAAKRSINNLKNSYVGHWFSPWVWTNNGHAKCVYRPTDYSGRLVPITP